MIAVLRQDGLVLPFATVERGEWKTPWPTSARNQDLPIGLTDIPDSWWGGERPSDWTAVLADGSTKTLDVTAPVVYPIGCDRRVGLRSDYTSAESLPPVPVDPFPKDGLAISGGARLEPISRVSSTAPAAARLATLLTDELNRVEDDAIKAIERRTAWHMRIDQKVRHATPVHVDAWYRGPLDDPDVQVSWVELVRAYPARPGDEGCGLETFFSGWVVSRLSDPGKARVDLHARITYCDRKDVLYMLPFGRLKTGGDWYWIYQLSGWDGEWYQVTRVDDTRPRAVVESYGGGSQGCPR